MTKNLDRPPTPGEFVGPPRPRRPRWALRIFWTTGIGALGYTVFTRLPGEFLVPLQISLAVGLMIFMGEAGLSSGFGRAARERPLRILLSLVLGSAFFGTIAAAPVFVLYGMWVAGLDLVGWLRYQSVATIVMATALAGSVFFWVRLRFRVVYGASEAAVGLGIAYFQGSKNAATELPSDTQFYIAILTAGIYLVVRGLDNVHQGLEKRSDPIANAILRRAKLRP